MAKQAKENSSATTIPVRRAIFNVPTVTGVAKVALTELHSVTGGRTQLTGKFPTPESRNLFLNHLYKQPMSKELKKGEGAPIFVPGGQFNEFTTNVKVACLEKYAPWNEVDVVEVPAVSEAEARTLIINQGAIIGYTPYGEEETK